MIIRLFHAKVRPGKQDEFKRTLEYLTLPNIQARSGMLAFYPGQPTGADGDEFVLVTVWKDLAAMESRTRSDFARAIIPEEALPLLEEWRVDNYKSFGVLEPTLKPLFNSL